MSPLADCVVGSPSAPVVTEGPTGGVTLPGVPAGCVVVSPFGSRVVGSPSAPVMTEVPTSGVTV